MKVVVDISEILFKTIKDTDTIIEADTAESEE